MILKFNKKNNIIIPQILIFNIKKITKNMEFNKEVMLAGNIKVNDNLENYKKIADIIDISGGVEESGLKSFSKMEIFLNKIKKINNET